MAAPALTLVITTPDGSQTRRVKPPWLRIPHAEFGEAAMLMFELDSKFDEYTDETDMANFIQDGSWAVVTRGSQKLWEGKLRGPAREEQLGEAQRVIVEGVDPLEALNHTLAGVGTERLFLSQAEEYEGSAVPLVLGESSVDAQYPYYPAPGHTNNYMDDGGSYGAAEGTLDADIGSGDTSIRLTAITDSGFPPRGYAKIGSEVFWYDGLHPDPGESSKYTFRNCVRGAKGTSAAGHTAAASIYANVALPVCTSDRILIEGQVSSGPDVWEPLGSGQFDVNQAEGRFEFKGDPEAAPYNAGSGYLALRATYTMLDLSDAATPTLESVADALLKFSGDGGPAIDAGNIDIDIDRVAVDRLKVDQTQHTLPVLRGLIARLELDAMNTGDAVVPWYDSANSNYCLHKLTQAGTPDHVLRKFELVSEQFESARLASAVLVGWQGSGPPLASPTRCWHPDRGDAWGGQTVSGYRYQYVDRELGNGWNLDEASSGNNLYTHLMFDGNENSSGWGLQFPAAINSNTVIVYFWNPGSPTSYPVDHIRCVLDLRRFIKSVETRIEIVGYTGFSTGDPPTPTGLLHLDDNLIFCLSDDVGPSTGAAVKRVGWVGGAFYDDTPPGSFGGRR